jgi:hypothetical protein
MLEESGISVYKPVTSKENFVARFCKGEFGNRTQVWDSVDEYLESCHVGMVHLRNRIVGGPTWYHLKDKWELLTKYREVLKNTPASQWYVGEMIPTEVEKKLLIQGEVQQSTSHIDLYFSTVPEPMRSSLAKGGTMVKGIKAVAILKHYLDPSSYDWIMELLSLYPNHVVEFSCYGTNIGILVGMNAVVWECRLY